MYPQYMFGAKIRKKYIKIFANEIFKFYRSILHGRVFVMEFKGHIFIFAVSEVMCVLKGNAYGHGAVPVARHLEKNGFSYFTVATSLEGEELRRGGVKGYIQILGIYHVLHGVPYLLHGSGLLPDH